MHSFRIHQYTVLRSLERFGILKLKMENYQDLHGKIQTLQDNFKHMIKRIGKLESEVEKTNRLIAINMASINCNFDKLLVLDLFVKDGEWVVRFRRRPATKERIECKSKHMAIWKNLALPRQYMKKIANRLYTKADSHSKLIVLKRASNVDEAVQSFAHINDLLSSFDRSGQAQFFSNLNAYLKSTPLDAAPYYSQFTTSLDEQYNESDTYFEMDSSTQPLPPLDTFANLTSMNTTDEPVEVSESIQSSSSPPPIDDKPPSDQGIKRKKVRHNQERSTVHIYT